MDLGQLRQSPLFKWAVVGVIGVLIISFFFGPRKQDDSRLMVGNIQESLGQVAADQAAKVLGDKGGAVLLIMGSGGVDPTDPSRGIRAGFEAGLKRHPQLSLAGVEVAPIPEDGSNVTPNGPRLAYLDQILGQHAGVACIVSFIQSPNLTTGEMQVWNSTARPKLISMFLPTTSHPWQHLLKQGIMQAALIRSNSKLPETEPKGPYQQIFDQFYAVVTKENLSQYSNLTPSP